MRNLGDFRELYGQVFVLELPDGQIVPFSLLSLSDYFTYSNAFAADIIPAAILEDEIFRKCVKNETLIDEIYKQKAGTPTTVADTILKYSAPSSSQELMYFLNHNRQIVNNVFYYMVNIICLGFPGYTPDNILAKDFHEISFLFALAEKKLLETGMISEPFNLEKEQEKPKKKKPKVDIAKLKNIYEQQEKQEYNIHKLKSEGKQVPKVIKEDETPKFEDNVNENGEVIISAQELKYNNRRALEEEDIKMIKEAQYIFGDYIEKLKKGEKIKIKSEDERLAEAKARMEENRKKFIEKAKRRK